jgi:RHS repeat-associated protein
MFNRKDPVMTGMKPINADLLFGYNWAAILLFFFAVSGYSQSSMPTASTPGAPAGSYKLSGLDTVNLYNGNLNFSLPLIRVGGRGDVSHTISLAIERQWTFSEIHEPWQNPGDTVAMYSDSYPVQDAALGSVYFSLGGSMRGDACDSYPTYWVTWTWDLHYTEPDGTQHQLRSGNIFDTTIDVCGGEVNLGNVFQSSDGSFIKLVTDSNIRFGSLQGGQTNYDGYLYFPDGTKSRVVNGKILWKQDRNGNRIESTQENWTEQIKDTLGRGITVLGTTEEPYGPITKYSYKGFGGQERTIRIGWANSFRTTQPYDIGSMQTYGQLFAGGTTEPTIIHDATNYYSPAGLPGHVWLPDGRSYEFQYNVYGQLARVILPTGGAIEYDYYSPVSLGFGRPAVNRVKEKREYDENNVLRSKTTFSATTNTVQGRPGTIVTVKRFDASDNLLGASKHYFYGVAGAPSAPWAQWWEGKEYKTEALAIDGVTVLRRSEKEWHQRTPTGITACSTMAYDCGPENNPFVAETTETLVDANLVGKTTAIDPSTGQYAFDVYNNQTDSWVYDYGNGAPGQFLKRTHTDFVTDPNYLSQNLTHLPLQSWTSSDAAGVDKAALTRFEYDNYAADTNHLGLWPRSGAFGHNSAEFGIGFQTRGNVTAVTSYADALNQTEPVTAYSQYDILGNVVKTIDARGNASTIGYDDNFGSPDGEAQSNTAPGQLNGQSTFAFPTSVTNPLGWTAYTQYDYFTGAPVNSEDPNGAISKTIYNDPLDRPTQSVTAVGTPLESQTAILYDDANRRVRQTSDLDAPNDNLLRKESLYDGFGRTTETRSYEAGGGYRAVQTQYDALGRPYKQSNPFRLSEIDANNPVLWTTTTFDTLGRVTQVETPDGAKALTGFDGNRTLVTDQAGKRRISKANALGQLTDVWEITGQDQWTEAVTFGNPAVNLNGYWTHYGYDVLNNLTTISQGVQTRSFSYDNLSRLTSASNPESGTIEYRYDPNGNLLDKTDARGVVTEYVYDPLNRVKERKYSTPNGVPANYQATPNVAYTYGTAAPAIGQLTKVSSSVSTTEYTSFDILGRVTAHRQTTDGGDPSGYTTGYTYNLAGALVEETYPSGRVIKNVLDGDGDLSIVQSKKDANHGFWNYAQSFTYSAAGAVTSMQRGNGRWESTVFNSRLQPTQIALGATAGGFDLLKLNFEYGDWTTGGTIDSAKNNGNIVQQTITVPNSPAHTDAFLAVQKYYYDPLNRIDDATEDVTPNGGTASRSWQQDFSYDRYGNRNVVEANTTTIPRNCGTSPNLAVCTADRQKYNPAINTSNNRLSTSDGYAFDPAGNTTDDPDGRTFIYDAENKQAEVRDASDNVVGQYFYNGDGQRVKKIVPATGEVTVFVHDAAGKQIAEYSTTVAPQTEAKVNYLTADHLGSPRINTDQSGAVVSRHDYHPFGEEISSRQRINHPEYHGDEVRKQFTGYERDEETELDYAQARYYAKELGRFTLPDPLLASGRPGSPQTWNRFAYVLNNPLITVDRNGLYECTSTSQDECRAFRNKLNSDRLKLADIKAKYGENSDEYRKAKKSLDSFGCESKGGTCIEASGKDAKGKPIYEKDTASNVKVSFNALSNAQTSLGKKDGKYDGNVYVNFANDYAQNPGLIGNEGSNVIAFQTFLSGGGNGSKYQAEFDGLFVQAVYGELDADAAGDDYAYFPVNSRGARDNYEVNYWEKGWETADHQTVRANRQEAINEVLQFDRKYELTPQSPNRVVQ